MKNKIKSIKLKKKRIKSKESMKPQSLDNIMDKLNENDQCDEITDAVYDARLDLCRKCFAVTFNPDGWDGDESEFYMVMVLPYLGR